MKVVKKTFYQARRLVAVCNWLGEASRVVPLLYSQRTVVLATNISECMTPVQGCPVFGDFPNASVPGTLNHQHLCDETSTCKYIDHTSNISMK